jgi:hypothetical protein
VLVVVEVTMEWVRRHPRTAAGLSLLAVLCVGVIAWGVLGNGSPSSEALPGSALPAPTSPRLTLPTLAPSGSPAPTGSPASIGDALANLPGANGGQPLPPGLAGSGGVIAMPAHHVVISAGSDGPLLGVGWNIPTADGQRKGKDLSHRRTFGHATTAYGKPNYAQLFAKSGPDSSYVWCTVSVDGRVTERQEGHGPWAGVYCVG